MKNLTRDPVGNWAAEAERAGIEIAVVLHVNGEIADEQSEGNLGTDGAVSSISVMRAWVPSWCGGSGLAFTKVLRRLVGSAGRGPHRQPWRAERALGVAGAAARTRGSNGSIAA